MPLTYPIKPKKHAFAGVRNAVLQIISRLNPDILLILFLVVAVLTITLRLPSVGFNVVFGLFVAGYFGERMIKILQKNVGTNKDTQRPPAVSDSGGNKRQG